MRNYIICIFAALLCSTLLISGCGSEPKVYGQEITEKNITSISHILADPAQFESKAVKIRGKIMEECPSGCWFNLKDDSGTIFVNIHPKNFIIPQASGRMATVEGVAKNEGMKISFIGSGVEIE